MKNLILMAGNIGSGKTSLTQLLGKELNWATAYESVNDNPYISDFYRDMHTWSFHLQIYFLGNRSLQHREMATLESSAIIDRSIYEDAHIFVRALREMGNISERDFNAYLKVYEQIVPQLPKPDLLIYLRAPVPVLMRRIQARARNIETGISQEYLQLLDCFYEDWIKNFELCPVLTIRSDDLDFVHKPEHLQQVIDHIHNRLVGKDELLLS